MMLYVSCPLKYDFSRNIDSLSTYNGDSRNLISSALKDTYIKFFQMRGTRRAWRVKEAMNFFSKRWIVHQLEFESISSEPQNITSTLLKAHNRVMNIYDTLHKDSEVAVVNLPIERSFKDFTVTDTIDVILVNKVPRTNRTTVELLVLDGNTNKLGSNDLGARLRATLALGFIKRNLMSYDTSLECNIINVYHNYKQEISLEREHRFNYVKILKSIAKSMEDNLIYPTANADTCSSCIFKSDCIWSQSK